MHSIHRFSWRSRRAIQSSKNHKIRFNFFVFFCASLWLFPFMQTDLSGKVVVITGAPGAIGSSIALRFGQEGAKLVLHYRSNRANVEALERKLGSVDSIIVRANLAKEVEA